MKLNPDWLADDDIQILLAACTRQGITLRFVGGAVRDTILMREVGDIDAATPTHAPDVQSGLEAEGIRIVPTGLKHGTVTAVLPARTVEITTLRQDVETDGRHAKVAPTTDWELDAARRDFTMNALYLSPEGELFDYYNGTEDALHGRVRFIGDAAMRIEEDGLRCLRFFRFLATHGEPPASGEAIDACRSAHWMLEEISGERIAQEMQKLLMASNPTYALRLMEEANIAAHVFAQPLRLGVFTRLTMLEHTARVKSGVWGRCAALLQSAEGAQWIGKRWRLSNKDAKQLALLASLPRLKENDPLHVHTRVIRLYGKACYRDLLLLSAAENGAFDLVPLMARAQDFTVPEFPVTGEDLKQAGITSGPAMGEVLKRLEDVWEQSDYTLTKEALLAQA